ncbi:hypothetical protein GCM10010844_37710 [Deinococcus radiotolerans]|uniref:Amine oxidase domain-containing protein n=1 Tax=Deinococcus radiotolerans TaxID=1309407 RepID=A0ABQ2FPX2_9DEIO|nr:NAD(P)/FAD-dependent oxidoreductase [Deinococcus radiotolerans]GGL15350.1 hypothetical protein GCM10010844_37710 [Deinococcus radiotolerans]
MTRTPLLHSLLGALSLARHAERQGLGTGDVLEERERAVTRRAVLRASAAAAGLTLTACARPLSPGPAAHLGALGGAEEVAVIGGGIAGLVAAYRLTQAGVPCRVFEASGRAGGRMHTLRGQFARPVELGGELIDSGHKRLRRLAAELRLNLLDLTQTDVGLTAQWFDFGGQRYSEAQAVDAFRPLARQIDRDLASLGAETITYRNPDTGRRLDALSVRAYLESIGAGGWLLSLLDVAYTIEYGLDATEQSSLNFLYLVGNRPGQFELFGYSDERYSIEGGNDQVPRLLAQRLRDRVQYGSRLDAVTLRSDGRYALTLNEGGTLRRVTAPRVVFALPFTTLRNVNLSGVPLPAVKRRAIQDLGYGTNAKLIAGFTRRLWRDTYGSCGEVYTDRGWQNTWESSRAASAPGGCLTNYLGARRAFRWARAPRRPRRTAGWAAWRGCGRDCWPPGPPRRRCGPTGRATRSCWRRTHATGWGSGRPSRARRPRRPGACTSAGSTPASTTRGTWKAVWRAPSGSLARCWRPRPATRPGPPGWPERRDRGGPVWRRAARGRMRRP